MPPVSFGDRRCATTACIRDSDSGRPRLPGDVHRPHHQRHHAHALGRGGGQHHRPPVCRPQRQQRGRSVRRVHRPDRAIPLDGTNQEPNGYWEIDQIVNLNDPQFFPHGRHCGRARHGRRPGRQRLRRPTALNIFIDTQGPQVTSVFITDGARLRPVQPQGPEADRRRRRWSSS